MKGKFGQEKFTLLTTCIQTLLLFGKLNWKGYTNKFNFQESGSIWTNQPISKEDNPPLNHSAFKNMKASTKIPSMSISHILNRIKHLFFTDKFTLSTAIYPPFLWINFCGNKENDLWSSVAALVLEQVSLQVTGLATTSLPGSFWDFPSVETSSSRYLESRWSGQISAVSMMIQPKNFAPDGSKSALFTPFLGTTMNSNPSHSNFMPLGQS